MNDKEIAERLNLCTQIYDTRKEREDAEKNGYDRTAEIMGQKEALLNLLLNSQMKDIMPK